MAGTGTLQTVATVGVLGFVGLRLASGLRYSLRRDGRGLVREIVGGIRWRHVLPVPFVLAAVVALANVFVRVPGLSWGWWTALGGYGNPVTGGTDQTTGTVWEWLVPLVFLTMLLPALPLFAHAEERMFRAGAEGWSSARRAVKCVQFGLAHAIIGIPIGVALALTCGGAYFMFVYLRTFARTRDARAAVVDSTRAHTAYNGGIIGVVLVVLLLGAVGVA